MRNLLALVLMITLIGCSDNPIQEEATDFDFSQLEPLLNSDVAREFIRNPWDVDLNGEVNLNDLVLLTTYHSPAAAPNLPSISGPLKISTKLNNGLYELQIVSYAPQNQKNLIEILVTNVGDDRGIVPHISQANFRIDLGGKRLIAGNNWLGNIPLGEKLTFRLSHGWTNHNQTTDVSNPLIGIDFSELTRITFQATSDMAFISGDGLAAYATSVSFNRVGVFSSSNAVGIPTGTTIGAPIVFTVESND